MDNDHHDDAAPAPQESGEPSEVPAEASQDSVPAAESSPDEAAAADPPIARTCPTRRPPRRCRLGRPPRGGVTRREG